MKQLTSESPKRHCICNQGDSPYWKLLWIGVAGMKAPKLRTKVSGGLSSFVLLPANSLGHEHRDVTPALGAIFFRFTVIPISR